jgi:subtilisin family serine protease
VNIALLDSGVYTKHPDLKGAFADCEPIPINEPLFPDLTDKKQANLPYCGINLVGRSNSLEDQDGHGTSVAGILAAQHNTKGIASAGCNVALIPVRMLSESTPTTMLQAIEGILYVYLRRSDAFPIPVMNCSWRNGSDEPCLEIEKEFFRGIGDKTLAVCAAGNDGDDVDKSPVYPAAFAASLDNVISVTASNGDGSRPALANYGKTVWIAAPGTNVDTTSVYPLYETVGGSSIAASFVSTAASFVMTERPTLSPANVRSVLCNSVRQDVSLWPDITCKGVIDFGRLHSEVYKIVPTVTLYKAEPIVTQVVEPLVPTTTRPCTAGIRGVRCAKPPGAP